MSFFLTKIFTNKKIAFNLGDLGLGDSRLLIYKNGNDVKKAALAVFFLSAQLQIRLKAANLGIEFSFKLKLIVYE